MAAEEEQPKMANLRKRRFPYTPVACEKCQRRKIKCSGEKPSCKGCRDNEFECVYKRTTRFRSSRRLSVGTSTQSSEDAVDKDQWSGPTAAEKAPKRQMLEPADTAAAERQVGGSDFYIRFAERRLSALSPEQSSASKQNHQKTTPSSTALQTLIEQRAASESIGAIAAFDEEYWMGVLFIYQEEIALQYPFLDLDELRRRIRTIKHDAFLMGGERLSPEARRAREGDRIDEILILLHAIVSMLSDPTSSDIVNSLVEEFFAGSVGRSQLNGPSKDELIILILSSIYFFLTDREIRAWRGISIVMRLMQELSSRSLDGMDEGSSSTQLKDLGEKFYWTAYTLDRRWSFGTGMPFAVQGSEIYQQPSFPDDTLSSAYLKSMVAYANIASEVKKTVLEPSMSQDTISESTRDFLNFRVIHWKLNLPPRLQFGGVVDKFDETKETRGEYKLRLILHLRANQMRTVIYRKLAVQAERSNLSPSSANVMVEIAQETLQILIGLARETSIYRAQQKTFNHFLETALSSLLLVMCSEGGSQKMTYLNEVVGAIDLVQQLSTQSPITRRLGDKLQGIREVVRNLQASQGHETRNVSQPGPEMSMALGRDGYTNSSMNYTGNPGNPASITHAHANAPNSSSPAQVSTGLVSGSTKSSAEAAGQTSATPYRDLDQQGATPRPRSSQHGLDQPPSYPPNSHGSAGLDLDSAICPDLDMAQDPQFLDDDFPLLQFPELGDILKDYEYFSF